MAESKSSSLIFELGLSYLNVPGLPLSPLTLGQLVDEAARKWGDSECYYDVPMNTRLTFGQLKNEVDSFAGGLLKIGLTRGDRMGIWGANSCRWIVTFLGAAKIGVIIVPLNPSYEAAELLFALNYLSVKCLVLGEPVKTRDLYGILNDAVPDMKIENGNDDGPIISSTVAPHLQTLIYMGSEGLNGARLWTEVLKLGTHAEALEKMRRAAETVQFDDILYTPFTSGTTGRPKGAMISHHAHVNIVLRVGNRSCLTPEDRNCQILPIFHLYGCYVVMLPLCSGCSVVMPSATYSPSTANKITAQEKCTWFHGTPTMYFDMLNSPGSDLLDLTSLRGAVVSGASVPKQLLMEMTQKYGISKVTVAYGSSEANGFTLSRVDDPSELMFTAVGYPHQNTETKIIDARGHMLPVGQTGEVCCRSYCVMRGYWENPEKTREVIDSAGWFHTGDAGFFLESGHLVIAGRFKDILIRGGENIHPKEIEDFLYQNLDIEQVHVFGVSDVRLGEVVAAWLLPKPKDGVVMDMEHVKRVCEGKISRSKIPVYIKFVHSKEDFPRTAIGKTQKNVMRRQFEQELGLTFKLN